MVMVSDPDYYFRDSFSFPDITITSRAYSFIQLNELGRRRENENAQTSKQ